MRELQLQKAKEVPSTMVLKWFKTPKNGKDKSKRDSLSD